MQSGYHEPYSPASPPRTGLSLVMLLLLSATLGGLVAVGLYGAFHADAARAASVPPAAVARLRSLSGS